MRGTRPPPTPDHWPPYGLSHRPRLHTWIDALKQTATHTSYTLTNAHSRTDIRTHILFGIQMYTDTHSAPSSLLKHKLFWPVLLPHPEHHGPGLWLPQHPQSGARDHIRARHAANLTHPNLEWPSPLPCKARSPHDSTAPRHLLHHAPPEPDPRTKTEALYWNTEREHGGGALTSPECKN